MINMENVFRFAGWLQWELVPVGERESVLCAMVSVFTGSELLKTRTECLKRGSMDRKCFMLQKM
jgi:hypothetical protein